jgi:integrase
MTMNRELELMRSIFGYGVNLGLLLKNPAEDIERRRVVHQQMQTPTREQFRKLVATIRESDGRKDSQAKASHGANLVELLAYSGCRLSEATALRWRDLDFEKNTLTITRGEGGTKNHKSRTIPMTQALVAHLKSLHDAEKPASKHEAISKTANTKNASLRRAAGWVARNSLTMTSDIYLRPHA